MRILAFGTYDAKLHPRILTLIEGLRSSGDVVRELNAPLGMSTADKVKVLKNPARLPRLAFRMLNKWATLAARSIKFHGKASPDAVIVGYMGHFDILLARLCFPGTRIILDHLISAAGTAQDRGDNVRLKLKLLRLLDRVAIACADVVVVDTVEHREALTPAQQCKAIVLPVGAPQEWFDTQRVVGEAGTEPLSIVFYGLFTPLQGTLTIARALRALHERRVPVSATLVGTGQDFEQAQEILSGVPVNWIDWVESEKLPQLVANHDVCLGIFGTTDKGLRVVPNKVYQGAAVGCAIVTSSTEPQRRALGDAALYAEAGDPEALADVLERLASDRDQVDWMRSRARQVAVENFAPMSVVEPLRKLLA